MSLEPAVVVAAGFFVQGSIRAAGSSSSLCKVWCWALHPAPGHPSYSPGALPTDPGPARPPLYISDGGAAGEADPEGLSSFQ